MPDETDQELGTTQVEQSTETTTEVEQPDPSTDTQQTESTQAKPDWHVDKYGPDYESKADYWKDTATYWRGETDKEKKKRQNRVPLEEFRPKDEGATAKPNLNGNGADRTSAADAKPKFDDVEQLLEHINKQNAQFFEKNFKEKLTESQRESNFANSMQKARRDNTGDPDNGIPSFDDVEQDVLRPLIESNPKVLALLKELPGDPAENAYTLGILVKCRNINGLRELFQRQGREQFADKLKQREKEAVRLKSGKSGPTTVKITPEEILNMSKEEFRKYEAQQTGKPY